MDFGSVQCLPKNPLCGDCIQKKICYAFIHKKQDCLPVKKKKAALLKRFFNYYVFRYKNRTLIKKRGESDVWAGLVDFYLDKKNIVSNNDNINKLYKISSSNIQEKQMLFDGLESSGSISRGFNIGNNQNSVLCV